MYLLNTISMLRLMGVLSLGLLSKPLNLTRKDAWTATEKNRHRLIIFLLFNKSSNSPYRFLSAYVYSRFIEVLVVMFEEIG